MYINKKQSTQGPSLLEVQLRASQRAAARSALQDDTPGVSRRGEKRRETEMWPLSGSSSTRSVRVGAGALGRGALTVHGSAGLPASNAAGSRGESWVQTGQNWCDWAA